MITKVIEISSSCTDIYHTIAPAAQEIKRGGLVVFPTETVYGLGADATNEKAVAGIYEAKGRPSDNPLIIHISKPEDAEKYTYTSPVYYLLAQKYMPGPLTVVLKSRDIVPKRTRGGLDTVAVRCPSDPIARALISLSGVPIAAPSANISGSPSPTAPKHVMKDMMGRVDYILCGGECEVGLESTIVAISEGEDSVTVLRPGRITPEQIERETGLRVYVSAQVTEGLKDNERPLSPGMKYRHYAPHSEVVLLDGDREKCAEYINKAGQNRIAILSYSEDKVYYSSTVMNAEVVDFGKAEDMEAHCRLLFNILRDLDEKDYDTIYAPVPPLSGLGLALYNRMIRAAAHKIIRL